jgi:hypothetical protein
MAPGRACRLAQLTEPARTRTIVAEAIMWYHPAAFTMGKRDVIGAWLLCLVAAALFFGWPLFESII